MTGFKRTLMVVGGCAVLTVVGFMVISPVFSWASRKLYRATNTGGAVDLDGLGPEVEEKTDTSEDEARS